MKAPVILFCNNNQWAISTPLSAQTAAPTLADKAVGYGMPGVRVDGGDVLAVYEATREAVERARAGDGPTLIEAVTYRAAPMRRLTIPRSTSTRSGSKRSGKTSASAAMSGISSAWASLRRPGRRRSGTTHSRSCARALRPQRPSRRRTSRLSSSTRTRIRPRPLRPTSRSCGGFSGEGAPARRGRERCTPRRDGARSFGSRHGRGCRSSGGRLPRDRRLARSIRGRSLHRHAARGSRDRGDSNRALHGRLASRLRDAIRRFQLPGSRPADQPRRALSLANAREDVVSPRDPDAVRGQCPGS